MILVGVLTSQRMTMVKKVIKGQAHIVSEGKDLARHPQAHHGIHRETEILAYYPTN